MSAAYATPLNLEVAPSARLQGFLLVSHLLALLSILLLPWPALLKLVLLVALAASYAYSRRRCGRRYRLSWRQQDWSLQWQGRACVARLLPSSLLSRWLIILDFRCDDGRRLSLPVLPDSLDADSLRRLRVRLRVEGLSIPAERQDPG